MVDRVVSHFDVLGVPRRASGDEIRSAYLHLARQLHPDQHPGASSEEQRRLHDAMARVNRAWSVLQDPEQRAQYAADLDGRTITLRPPRVGECDLCGHGPAIDVTFMHQKAWILAASRYTTELELCRGCALSFGRSQQNRTLWTGWWGVFAFFTNLWVIWTNAKNLRAAGTLGQAKRNDSVVAPLTGPLPAGRSTLMRSGIWFTAVLLLIVVSAGAGGGGETNETSGWRVGSCVSLGAIVQPVSCGGVHAGLIVAEAPTPASCPFSADSYMEGGTTVWCIDTDG